VLLWYYLSSLWSPVVLELKSIWRALSQLEELNIQVRQHTLLHVRGKNTWYQCQLIRRYAIVADTDSGLYAGTHTLRIDKSLKTSYSRFSGKETNKNFEIIQKL